MNTARDMVVLLGGAALVYWIFQKKIAGPGGVIDTTIARPIAYVISALTLPAKFHAPGGAVLPDGGYVSWDAIVESGSKLDSRYEFVWRGIRYRATGRRPDNNYDTVRV